MERLQENNYDVLIIPIDYNKKFIDLSLEEIQQYYSWFLNIKCDRIKYFCNFIFQGQQNCLEESKLEAIDHFLQNSVNTIPKPPNQYETEMNQIPTRFKPYAQPDNYLFDRRTISICYDIGIYLGELIIKLDDQIRWGLETNDKYSDYGQPVLIKTDSKLSINPFTVCKNTAAKIYEGRYKNGQIISFFEAWKKGFNVLIE